MEGRVTDKEIIERIQRARDLEEKIHAALRKAEECQKELDVHLKAVKVFDEMQRQIFTEIHGSIVKGPHWPGLKNDL